MTRDTSIALQKVGKGTAEKTSLEATADRRGVTLSRSFQT